MKKTVSYLKHTRKEAILGPLFKMLEVCFELLVPVIVSLIVDNGIRNRTDADISYIAWMCLLLMGFAILGLLSSVTAQYFSAKAAVRLATNLRNDLFRKIESLQYEDLDEMGTSTLITRMTSDVNQVQTGINMVLRLLLRSPVVVIGAVIVAFGISRDVGFIFLGTVPALFIIIFLILLISIPLYRKSQERLDRIVRLSRENLSGVRVIRAFNRQKQEEETFVAANRDLSRSQLFVGRVSALTNPLTYALMNLFIILLVYVGALNVNEGALSQGNVIALYSLSSQILVEMVKFANLIITISKAVASANRLETVLRLQPHLDRTDDTCAEETPYFLEFRDVDMRYRGSSQLALSGISFKISAGQTVGVIGGTGSGKTTLVHLICHFYDICGGKILLEGKELSSYDPEQLRGMISLVPQRAKLFKGTIEENLRWGNPDATQEELAEAIELAQAGDILRKKELGLQEPVEQDGRNFSGGQKQRLCIARALVRPGKILILDDSSSALDYATDARLRQSLKRLKQKPTTFLISQRTASLQHCDIILVLDHGALVGTGTHEELLRGCEVYREIYDSQFRKEGSK